MAIVHFSSYLAQFTGGLQQLAVDAPRVHELKVSLTRRFPGLAPRLETMAVAIDGDIYNDADYQSLRDGSEVHFVPRIVGG